MVGDHVAVIAEVHEVVRVQSVVSVDLDLLVDAAQGEDHARLESLGRVRRDNGMEALGR